MNRRIIILYVCFATFVLLDVITTIELLKKGGIEVNPITLWQWEKIGFQNTLAIKIGSILFLGLLIWLISIVAKTEHDRKIADYVLTGVLLACTIFFIGVVVNNVYWLWRASNLPP